MKKQKEPIHRRRPGNLPGSRVDVNTYYKTHSTTVEKSSPFSKLKSKKNGRKKFVRTIDYVFFGIIGLGFLLSLVVSPRSKVVINDSTYHPVKDYTVYVNAQLGRFSNRNKITFNDESIKASLARAFPEAISTSVELPIFGQQPVVTIVVSQPAFFISSAGSQYLLSGNGVAVDLKSYYPKLAGLPTISDESGFVIKKGRHVLSQQDISFLETIVTQLKHQHVPVEKLVLPKAPEEVDLYTTDNSYYTRFFMGGDSGVQVGQYLAARNNFKTHPVPAKYLDVRVAGKVFYQ